MATVIPGQLRAAQWRHSARCTSRTGWRHFHHIRAEQSVKWLDKEASTTVRNDYDAVIVLAGGFIHLRKAKAWMSSVPLQQIAPSLYSTPCLCRNQSL